MSPYGDKKGTSPALRPSGFVYFPCTRLGLGGVVGHGQARCTRVLPVPYVAGVHVVGAYGPAPKKCRSLCLSKVNYLRLQEAECLALGVSCV